MSGLTYGLRKWITSEKKIHPCNGGVNFTLICCAPWAPAENTTIPLEAKSSLFPFFTDKPSFVKG